ncbi:MAG: class I SAM-dependent methyltransferase [Acidobacteria bacterium]|nr:MAG: class I SAM-dependent methyltransferase [Acidobacteriota bacterium]
MSSRSPAAPGSAQDRGARRRDRRPFWKEVVRGEVPLESYHVPDELPPLERFENAAKLVRHFKTAHYPTRRLWLTFLMRALDLSPGARVLEVGPGCGFLAYEMCRRGYDYTGYDMVPQNEEMWRVTSRFYGLDGKVVVADICEAEGPPFFDAIFSLSTFEHIHDQPRAIRRCYELLRPGGRFVVFDGNILDPRMWWRQVVMRPIRSGGRQGGLKWVFGKGTVYEDYGLGWRGKEEDVKSIFWWRRQLRAAGFDVVTVLTSGYFRPALRALGLWPFAGTVLAVAEKPR